MQMRLPEGEVGRLRQSSRSEYLQPVVAFHANINAACPLPVRSTIRLHQHRFSIFHALGRVFGWTAFCSVARMLGEGIFSAMNQAHSPLPL